jgi:glycosyltransferase involved in cell wall biosynthesis
MKYTILIATMGSDRLAEIVSIYLSDPGTDFEILIVFDTPNPDVAHLLKGSQADDRVRVLINEKNLGLTRSLIAGVLQAVGDIVVRNDDDDMPAGDRLALTRRYFEAHPEVDLAHGFAKGVSENGNRSWDIKGPTTDEAIKSGLERRNFIVASSVAYRRAKVLAIGNYNELFRYAQDYNLYLRLAMVNATFGCISSHVVTRYYSSGAITVRKRKTQALFSFASRLIYSAERKDSTDVFKTILKYAWILLLPDWLRKVRRSLGSGR